jgi:hypothetical protein
MMLATGLLYVAFIMFRYVPSIPSFLSALSWNVVESYWRFFLCLMIKWFLSLPLLMCCITFIDLCMLNHPCIPGIKLTWS